MQLAKRVYVQRRTTIARSFVFRLSSCGTLGPPRPGAITDQRMVSGKHRTGSDTDGGTDRCQPRAVGGVVCESAQRLADVRLEIPGEGLFLTLDLEDRIIIIIITGSLSLLQCRCRWMKAPRLADHCVQFRRGFIFTVGLGRLGVTSHDPNCLVPDYFGVLP